MIRISSLPILAMAILAGCSAVDNPALKQEPSAASQAEIENRYAEALVVYKQKMAPIAHYLVKVCGPMADREYVACINGKRDEITALNIYPDDDKQSSDQRQILEQQLLSKAISRKEFRMKLEAGKSQKDAERLKQDIKTGIYTGRY